MDKLPLQISHALFRVCNYVKQKDVRARIEAHAVYLLESGASSDLEGMRRALGTIEKLVFLGEEIGEIHYHHPQILHGQFANLKVLLAAEEERVRVELAIADIFSGDYEKHLPNKSNLSNTTNVANGNAATSNGNGTWHVERHELIADKIRQLGNAAMRDVIAAFPDVSERTLRYDLQKLCDRQIIERIGNGGPASFYKIKQQFIAKDLRSVIPPMPL